LNVGEFIVPRDVVSWLGEKSIYGMVDKAKQERAQNAATTQTKPQMRQALPAAPAHYA
jgi:hypothetical protein